MTPIRHIAFLTWDYPAPGNPDRYAFLQQFVRAVAREGIACTVVHPQPLHRALSGRAAPARTLDNNTGGVPITVLRPFFFSLSARNGYRRLGFLNPSRATLLSFAGSARRALVRNRARPDAVCGQFLYLGGAAAVRVGAALGIPAFPCVGESSFWTVDTFGEAQGRRDLAGATGFIANSAPLGRLLQSRLGVAPGAIGLFPNGVDRTCFHPGDKMAARARYHLPPDRFIVAFVGGFNHRKGAVRTAAALDGLAGTGGVFIGSGDRPPRGPGVLFSRALSHDEIPEMLAAADAFVLPTLAEGCCNALLEAMACGLPVISSTGEFNDAVLDEKMSIRVDPLDVGAIRSAIATLRDNPGLRLAMGRAAVERAKAFDIGDRARNVLAFMNGAAGKGGQRP